tara:strand:+ start:10646 stop:11026 length:381 start_codon:yes stop_codon:yes gene_type:complete
VVQPQQKIIAKHFKEKDSRSEFVVQPQPTWCPVDDEGRIAVQNSWSSRNRRFDPAFGGQRIAVQNSWSSRNTGISARTTQARIAVQNSWSSRNWIGCTKVSAARIAVQNSWSSRNLAIGAALPGVG